MYETILVPTDGSSVAANAARHAVTLADRFDATLHALAVVTESLDPDGPQGADDASEATARVVELAADAGVPVETAVVDGSPDEEILRYVRDHGVDLVVMGTHGRTGLDRYLIGSVTERVVRRADVPVLTVRRSAGRVADAEAAIAIAREALAREGHEDVSFADDPYRERNTWVVPATADDGRVNVHVDAGTGDARVAHLDRN